MLSKYTKNNIMFKLDRLSLAMGCM